MSGFEAMAAIAKYNKRLRDRYSLERQCWLCSGCDQHKDDCVANVNEDAVRARFKR